MSQPRNFIDIRDFSRTELEEILDCATASERALEGRVVACIFEQPSTRTRLSFESAILHLGGHAMIPDVAGMQLGRGESPEDTGRVLASVADLLVMRTLTHERLHGFARGFAGPVINALTTTSHPCQLMADLLTLREHFGGLDGLVVVWSGVGANNMVTSTIEAAVRFNFELRISSPTTSPPDAALLDWAQEQGARVVAEPDLARAARGADVMTTDTWVSLGDDHEPAPELGRYQVNQEIMATASPRAVFLHCLPAYRGREVTAEVLDGPQSLIWEQVRNRTRAQEGILRYLAV